MSVASQVKPIVHEGVDVRLPATRHPTMPQGRGVVTAISGGNATVFVYPSEVTSTITVTVPHESEATKTSGWWKPTHPRKK